MSKRQKQRLLTIDDEGGHDPQNTKDIIEDTVFFGEIDEMDRDIVRNFAQSEARVRHWSEMSSMDEVAPTTNDNEDDDGDGDEGDGSECHKRKLKGQFTQA